MVSSISSTNSVQIDAELTIVKSPKRLWWTSTVDWCGWSTLLDEHKDDKNHRIKTLVKFQDHDLGMKLCIRHHLNHLRKEQKLEQSKLRNNVRHVYTVQNCIKLRFSNDKTSLEFLVVISPHLNTDLRFSCIYSLLLWKLEISRCALQDKHCHEWLHTLTR
jgi:hypothetical protein